MHEELITRFHRLVQQAEAQDVVLRDLARQKNPELPLAGARPLVALFNDARGLLNDVAQYEYYATPASARGQIARLISQLKSAIEQLEAEEVAYSSRNELTTTRDNALALLKAMASTGNAFLDSYVEQDEQEVRRWFSESNATLRKLFRTPWHAKKFADEVELQFKMAADGRPLPTGLSYLGQVMEDLFVSAPDGREPEWQSGKSERSGTNVFIGHGRSKEWKDLKDFIQDRMRLPWDEFNRVPVAGVPNAVRLANMLDAAAIAFLVLTAEDETASGKMQARMNVVHEVGLFQGRLGFSRAIVVLEEGCEEFSNIEGLGQIRFPKNNIRAAFHDVQLVLEHEGLVQPPAR